MGGSFSSMYFGSIKLFKFSWQNGRHVGSDPIIKHLGLSAPWITNARRVTELLAIIGPDSSNPDPYVLSRISSGITTGKGQALLAFLQARMEAAGIQ